MPKEAARRGKQAQPGTLTFAEYVIVFTTFPAATFSAAEIPEWYRLRWQVELVFKRFKSLAQLGHLPNYDDDADHRPATLDRAGPSRRRRQIDEALWR